MVYSISFNTVEVLDSSNLPSIYPTCLWGSVQFMPTRGGVGQNHPHSSTVPPPLSSLRQSCQYFFNSSTILTILLQLVHPPERASLSCLIDVVSASWLRPPLMTRTSPWQMSCSRQTSLDQQEPPAQAHELGRANQG